jgi:hypothetical protein
VAIPAAIRAHFDDEIQVKVKTGHDAYDQPVYADAVTVPCRITYREVTMVSAEGEQFKTAMRIYTQDISGFSSGAEVVLEDGTEWTVKGFNRPAWPDGTRHLRIDL